jgi:heme exporter protein D
MYFATLRDLWLMDGHGAYVWSAYAIVVLLFGVLVRVGLVRQRRVLSRVRDRMRRSRAESVESHAPPA